MSISNATRGSSFPLPGRTGTMSLTGHFPAITAIFNGTGFEYYDNIIANNMDEYKGIKNHPTALKEAFEKGQKVVAVLEKLNSAER